MGFQKFRIGYFADGPWAHEALKILVADESIKVCFICPRSDSHDVILEAFSKKYKMEWFIAEIINLRAFEDGLISY